MLLVIHMQYLVSLCRWPVTQVRGQLSSVCSLHSPILINSHSAQSHTLGQPSNFWQYCFSPLQFLITIGPHSNSFQLCDLSSSSQQNLHTTITGSVSPCCTKVQNSVGFRVSVNWGGDDKIRDDWFDDRLDDYTSKFCWVMAFRSFIRQSRLAISADSSSVLSDFCHRENNSKASNL